MKYLKFRFIQLLVRSAEALVQRATGEPVIFMLVKNKSKTRHRRMHLLRRALNV